MIHTITPNPALDLGGVVDDLVPNEKNYVYSETRFPGGNGINAARVISALGVPVTATGFLGGGTGDEIRDLLEMEGVESEFIEIQGHTRVSVTVSDKRSGLQTRLSFPGPEIRRVEKDKLLRHLSKVVSPALLVIGGSLPAGFDVATLLALIRNARKRGISCVVDVPGKYLRPVVEAGVFLIKPNLVEFQELVGRKVSTRSAVLSEARKLTRKVSLLCVSSVEGGALLVSRDAAWFGKGPKVTVRSQVGAGDSMVGAMCAELWKRGDPDPEGVVGFGDTLLRWGLAAAMATLTKPGTQLGAGKEIRAFYPKVHIERMA